MTVGELLFILNQLKPSDYVVLTDPYVCLDVIHADSEHEARHSHITFGEDGGLHDG